jgi:hypothetical protein
VLLDGGDGLELLDPEIRAMDTFVEEKMAQLKEYREECAII